MATVLYLVSWWSYYDSMALVKEGQQKDLAQQIAALYEDGSDRTTAMSRFQATLKRQLTKYRGDITVAFKDGASNGVTLRGRNWTIDPDRSLIESTFTLEDLNPGLSGVKLSVRDDNRPSFFSALGQGVSWSLGDLIRSPEKWRSENAVKRSLPFYWPLVVSSVAFYLLLRGAARVADAANATLQIQRDYADRRILELKDLLQIREDALTGADSRLRDAQSHLAQAEMSLAAASTDKETVNQLKADVDRHRLERDKIQTERDDYQAKFDSASKMNAELTKPEAQEARAVGQRVLVRTKDINRIDAWIRTLDSDIHEWTDFLTSEIQRLGDALAKERDDGITLKSRLAYHGTKAQDHQASEPSEQWAHSAKGPHAVRFYHSPESKRYPVLEFLEGLPSTSQHMVRLKLTQLASLLDQGSGKSIEKVAGAQSLWEFKVNGAKDVWVRFLFVRSEERPEILVLTGFIKKQNRLDPAEIDKAEDALRSALRSGWR